MTVKVKICGVNAEDALEAAVEGGAAFVGFVFYPPSPRSLTPERAGQLASLVPTGITRTGLFVDADDDDVKRVVDAARLDMLQLHGAESPERVEELRALTGLGMMKAIGVEATDDLARADAYLEVVDWLMFDAKPPPAGTPGGLPGGNARAFDWSVLRDRAWPRPWMLAGGLTAKMLANAVRLSGAQAIDVSSGIEDRRGHKSPRLVRAFLEAARAL